MYAEFNSRAEYGQDCSAVGAVVKSMTSSDFGQLHATRVIASQTMNTYVKNINMAFKCQYDHFKFVFVDFLNFLCIRLSVF